jgi:DNA helicase MCM9
MTLHYPKLLLPIFDEAINETQSILFSRRDLFPTDIVLTIKPRCHARLINIPPTSEFSKNSIRQIHSYEVEKLIQITGIVTRTSSVRMLKVSKEYECQNPKCGYRFQVFADAERGHALPQPRNCPSSLRQSPVSNGEKRYSCSSTNLREIEGSAVCIDYQEIKIQDQMERLPAGHSPLSLLVSLQADIRVGEEVRIVGTIVRQWGGLYEKMRCQVHIYLSANRSVSACERDSHSFPHLLVFSPKGRLE